MSTQPELPVHHQAAQPRCLNCATPLAGEFCSHCGQHAQHHVHSTWAMLGEFIEDFFHADNRVWRTLLPLVFRPGYLTAEYLRGRRVAFTPPFRLYIVLSLIFFLVASIHGPADEVAAAPASATGSTSPADAGASAVQPSAADIAADPQIDAALDRILSRVPVEDRGETRQEILDALREDPARPAPSLADPCDASLLESALPGDLGKSARVLEACRKVTHENENFDHALKANIPKMMFLFLPLIALAGKALYLGSRRYYAEHLLFFVHYHAFFFLAAAAAMLGSLLFGWLERIGAGPWTVASGLLTTAVVVYVPLYLYRAMRRVYRQGRLVTMVKFAALTVAYSVSLLLTFTLATAFTALTL